MDVKYQSAKALQGVEVCGKQAAALFLHIVTNTHRQRLDSNLKFNPSYLFVPL